MRFDNIKKAVEDITNRNPDLDSTPEVKTEAAIEDGTSPAPKPTSDLPEGKPEGLVTDKSAQAIYDEAFDATVKEALGGQDNRLAAYLASIIGGPTGAALYGGTRDSGREPLFNAARSAVGSGLGTIGGAAGGSVLGGAAGLGLAGLNNKLNPNSPIDRGSAFRLGAFAGGGSGAVIGAGEGAYRGGKVKKEDKDEDKDTKEAHAELSTADRAYIDSFNETIKLGQARPPRIERNPTKPVNEKVNYQSQKASLIEGGNENAARRLPVPAGVAPMRSKAYELTKTKAELGKGNVTQLAGNR